MRTDFTFFCSAAAAAAGEHTTDGCNTTAFLLTPFSLSSPLLSNSSFTLLFCPFFLFHSSYLSVLSDTRSSRRAQDKGGTYCRHDTKSDTDLKKGKCVENMRVTH